MSEKRVPTYRDIKGAFDVGDPVYVLDDDGRYVPRRIKEIGKKGFLTDIGVVLYEDHGWLWRAFPVKEEENGRHCS